jgi:hypothetical protein
MSDPKPLTRNELAEFLPSQRAIKAFEKLFDLIPSSLDTFTAAIAALVARVLALETNKIYYGQTTVDCGAIGTFNSITSQFVSVPTLPTGAKVNATIRGVATADHTIDEIVNDNIDVRVSGITAASGFTLNVLCLNGSIYGDYIIDWSYSNGN